VFTASILAAAKVPETEQKGAYPFCDFLAI
jgi:hypothetical protein